MVSVSTASKRSSQRETVRGSDRRGGHDGERGDNESNVPSPARWDMLSP